MGVHFWKWMVKCWSMAENSFEILPKNLMKVWRTREQLTLRDTPHIIFASLKVGCLGFQDPLAEMDVQTGCTGNQTAVFFRSIRLCGCQRWTVKGGYICCPSWSITSFDLWLLVRLYPSQISSSWPHAVLHSFPLDQSSNAVRYGCVRVDLVVPCINDECRPDILIDDGREVAIIDDTCPFENGDDPLAMMCWP